jgi:serine/threonine protein kinase
MAPECLIGENYNLKADVYTFSIVLWEMLSRETPYSFARTKERLNYHVVEEQGRPDIDDAWPSQIKCMLRASFDGDMDKRPVSSSASVNTNAANLVSFVLMIQ